MVAIPNHFVGQTFAPVPAWARNPVPLGAADAAFRAGAALAILDARARAESHPKASGAPGKAPGKGRGVAQVHAPGPWGQVPAGVWRQRLALSAAAASSKIIRRGEDAAVLRDSFYLRNAGADPGPAGRLLLAWRGLDRSTPLDDDSVRHAADLFGLCIDNKLTAAIAAVQDIARGSKNPEDPKAAPVAAAQAASLVVAQRPDAELLSLWVADAVLAKRLNWPRPLALLAGGLMHRSLREPALTKAGDGYGRRPHPLDDNWTAGCCAACAIAAAAACELFDQLARGSQKLLSLTSRLRAKGAAAVVEKLHDEDAVSPSEPIADMSDRALRRLFERLVALGGVHELTGRPTFRLYGL